MKGWRAAVTIGGVAFVVGGVFVGAAMTAWAYKP